MVEKRKKFEERVNFRLFREEKKELMDITRHAKDVDGFRKFQNENHACRVAILHFIKQESNELIIKPGRPTKGRFNNR